jgi:hypothetical protein
LNPKPEYPRHNVINGKSAINVHKSLTDIPTYVSCRDIVAHGAM